MLTGTWPLTVSVVAFIACAVTLVVAGRPFAQTADRLADRTGLGEALSGFLLLGATTSLPGIITTGVSAYQGQVDLALSNAFGGIAAQTLFLAAADLVYRKANLEHAAPSLPNLLQCLILVALLSLVLIAATGPAGTFLGLHPITLLLPVVYLYGLHLVRLTQKAPMWRPTQTPYTAIDQPDPEAQRASAAKLWLRFALLAAVVAVAGYATARAGISIARTTGLSGTLVGGLITSVITSLPELVTVIAAVRIGALTLAVGDIVGGNAFDVLFVAVADAAYRNGSAYQDASPETLYLLGLTLLLTSILAAGLVHRQRSGVGFEGWAIPIVYVTGFVVLYVIG